MSVSLFRAKFTFVCDRCDLGYTAGRLCGFNRDRRLECAKCLVGHDPDDEGGLPVPPQEIDTRDGETPPPPSLFDNQPATGA